MDGSSQAEEIRVLLVSQDAGRSARLVRELGDGGVRARAVSDPREAVRVCCAEEVDVVVLEVPLPDADAVALCAAFKQGPAAPPLLLLDGAGQALQLERVLPRPVRPDAVLDGSAPTAKLLLEIRQLSGRRAVCEPTPPPPGPSFADLLMGLAAEGETGVLEVRAEELRIDVTLCEGRPVFAEGGGVFQTLGRLLLRRGKIREDEYVRVIERMTERVIRNESVRMGEVLVELGILEPAEVYEALERQVRERIVACFQWDHFESAFRPWTDVPAEVASFRVPPVEALVLEGIRTHYDESRLRPVLERQAERFPLLAGAIPHLVRQFGMTTAEQKFLHTIDGTTTLAALADGPLDRLHAAQVLAALLVTHHLELGMAPAVGRTQPARPARRAPPPDVRRIPAAPHVPGATRTLRSADRARRSLDSLRRQGTRERTAATPEDPRRIQLEAEHAYRKGCRLLAQNLLRAALEQLGRAVQLQGEHMEYRLWQAWAEYLASRDEEARMLAKAKVRATAQKLLGQHRTSPKAHCVLGTFLYDEGELDAAERHFQAALRAAPDDHEAQRGVRLVESRRRRR